MTTTKNERDLGFIPVVNPHPRRLMPTQITFYNDNGYICSLGIFSNDETQRNREYFDWLLAQIKRMDESAPTYR